MEIKRRTCEQCNKILTGRTDKRFCSTNCKNQLNNTLRKNTKSITQEVDSYLHRNREILALLIGNTTKTVIDRILLVRAGFRFDYMTGIYFNREHKMYRIVYDHAWMDFSDMKVLIVKKAK